MRIRGISVNTSFCHSFVFKERGAFRTVPYN